MIGVVIFVSGSLYILGAGLSAIYGIPLVRSLPIFLLGSVAILELRPVQRDSASWVLVTSYAVLSGLMVIGLLHTRAVSYGIWKTAIVIVHWLTASVVTIQVLRSPRRIQLFVAGMLSGGVLLTVTTVAMVGSPSEVLARMTSFTRATIDDVNPIRFGQLMCQTVLLCAGYLIYLRTKSFTVPLAVTAAVALFYALISGSKGPILALSAAFIVLSLVFTKRRLGAVILTAAVGYIAIVIGALILPSEFIEARFAFEGSRSVSSRVVRLATALNEAKGFSIMEVLIGRGTGDYAVVWTGADTRTYPHNLFAEAGYELGFSGLLVLVIALTIPVVSALRTGKYLDSTRWHGARAYLAMSLAMYVFAVVDAQTTGDIATNNQIALTGAILVSVARIGRFGGGSVYGGDKKFELEGKSVSSPSIPPGAEPS